MKVRLLITHLTVAFLILTLVMLGLNLYLLILSALVIAWFLSESAWRFLKNNIYSTAVWIRSNGSTDVPENSEVFTDIVEAVSAARQQFDRDLSALLADKHRAELILNNMRDGVVLTDHNGLVTLVNPAAAAVFRRPVAEFIGRPLMYSVNSQELDRLINQVIADSREAEAQIEVFMPRERQLHVLVLPIRNNPGPSAVMTVFQDVTSRRRIDAVRRAFVANVSHELKTPVAGIKLLADSLTTGIGVDDTAAKHFAAKLAREATHLSKLIEDLLDLSQLEAPEARPLFTPVSLSLIAKEVVTSFTEIAAANGISLRLEQATGLSKIRGHENQLRLMLRNLIENAIHYTPLGGDVLVKLRENGMFMIVEVIDSGIGIPARDRRRVFERFYRVDKARSRDTGGTGLGLSIVKHVVDNHAGKIELDSTVGVGSRFRISLPIGIRPAKDRRPQSTKH